LEHHGKEVNNPILMPLGGHIVFVNLIEEPRSPAERDLGKLREAVKNGLAMQFQTMPFSAANP